MLETISSMTHMFETAMAGLLAALAIPQVGLGAIFLIAMASATLLPMGSEPAVFALVKLQPDMFWPTVAVATLGNTAGGAISWWMGAATKAAVDHYRHQQKSEATALRWLRKFGPKTLLLSWLPIVGDPICAVAGWLRLPFWPCVFYMAVGKALRYVTMTYLLLKASNIVM